MFWQKLLQVWCCSQVLLYSVQSKSEIPETTTDAQVLCNTPLTQGLRDNQFSASTEYNQTHDASAARTKNDGWIASERNSYQHLKVDFENITEVSKISIQGSSNSWYTRSFRVSYSNDGLVWTPYNSRLANEPLGELFDRQGSTTVVDLFPSIKARYIVINPVTYYYHPALRIELYGCIHSTGLTVNGKSVSGVISDDTTWVLSQSPVIVDQSIIIRPGVTLTIQAGVFVIFINSDIGIDVWGTLVAKGITDLDVMLSSNEPVLAADSKWRGIVQKIGGNVTMEHTTVRQAVTGIQGNGSSIRLADSNIYSCLHGIRMSGGSSFNIFKIDMATDLKHAILLRSKVHDCVNGLLVHGILSEPNIFIAHSTFNRNKENGIEILNWDLNEQVNVTNLILYNTTFSKNYIGIYSDKLTLNSFYISHCSFIQNSRSGLRYFYWLLYEISVQVHVDISHSRFLENKIYGIETDLYCYNCKSSLIHKISFTNNLFLRERFAVRIDNILRETAATANISIENNEFVSNDNDVYVSYALEGPVRISTENNTFSYSRLPLNFKGENIQNNSAVITRNNFTNAFSTNSRDEAFKIEGMTAHFMNNTFVNSSFSTMINLIDGIGHSLVFNSVINTSASMCYLKVGHEFDENNVVVIDFNYWGATDMKFIKAKVCDFFHDSTKTVVKLDQYFTDEKMDIAILSTQIDDFYAVKDVENNATLVGGIIHRSIDFSSLGDDKLILERSFLILKGSQVNISGLHLSIMKNKGIRVYGSLTIGDESDTSVSTLLQLNGAFSTQNKWNGISLLSSDLSVYNLGIEGMDTFVKIDGNGSKVALHNCSTTTNKMQHLIVANTYGGHLSLILDNNIISATESLLYVSYTLANVNITIVDSVLHGRSNVIDVRETNSHDNASHVILIVSNSTLSTTARFDWLMYLEGCTTHLTSSIASSTFSILNANNFYGIHYMKYSSIELTVVRNVFGDAEDTLVFDFCGNSVSNYSKTITIIGNTFNSSLEGGYILIDEANEHDESHEITIENNTFYGNNISSHTGISCHSFRRNRRLILYINSNIFTDMIKPAVSISCELKKATIRNNVFLNNKQCIYVSSNYKLIDGLEITGNTFVNNTDSVGILFLGQTEYGGQIANITDNHFKGNTGTVIALMSPYIRIRHNYFENHQVLYNVKVLSSYYSVEDTVNASLNFWGTTDVRGIMKGIYDFNYDEKLLRVDFRPYLGSKNTSDIQNNTINFLSEDGEMGGNVNGNITLSLKDNSYLVVSNVYVNENDTLTLAAGVELRVKEGVGLFVTGALNISGTKKLPVRFISEKKGHPWRGLEINTVSDLVLSYVYLNDTQEGLTLRDSAVNIQNITSSNSRRSGITVNFQNTQKNVEYSFSEVNLENNLEDGLRVLGNNAGKSGFVSVSNCFIARNQENGITIQSNTEIKIMNCSIVENGNGGIYFQQYQGGMLYINNSVLSSNIEYAVKGGLRGGMIMDSCSIRNHTYRYYRYGIWYNQEYIHVWKQDFTDKNTRAIFRNTNFTGNTADRIKISYSYGDEKFVIVFENNFFANGSRTLLFSHQTYSKKVSILFANNTIEGNSVHEEFKDSALIEIYANKETLYTITMLGNLFTKNNGKSCLSMSSHKNNVNNGEMFISDNFFKDNNVSSVINIRGYISPQIHGNIFTSKFLYDCTISAPEFHISAVINATHNYWGTNRTRDVIDTVCGFEKDMSYSVIRIFPFFENENLNSLVSALHESGSETLGGEIETDTYITHTEWGSPVEVYRSIFIREGAGLYLHPGVILQFAVNRGIYVQGKFQVMRGDSGVVLESDSFDSFWYGIVINSTSYNSTDEFQMQNTVVKNTLHGIMAYTPKFEIKRSLIIYSEADCFTLSTATEVASYDFESTKFEACGRHGMNISTTGSISIANAHILNSSKGMAIRLVQKNNDVIIDIYKNKFEIVRESVLSVDFMMTDVTNTNFSNVLRIEQNSFKNSCGIEILTGSNSDTVFHDNDLSSADCTNGQTCFMLVSASNNKQQTQNMQFDLSANRFKNITDKCIVELKDIDKITLHGSFVFNSLQDNKATVGVLLANARSINVSRNKFDNPASVFDVITELKGPGSMNITNNWWGQSEEDVVYTRIMDERRNPDLMKFEVKPILKDFSVDCMDVNNCSSHGKCISPNQCRCLSGWSGPSCLQYDCSDVNNCYGNGVCVGPNECSCSDGWTGPHCVIASCSTVNNCTEHGFCMLPNVCACGARYTGNDCSACVPLHGGPTCQPCPECQHGTCSPNSGLCECEDVNWTGYLCDKCSETFYGPECLPLIKVLKILPNSGPEVGGGQVHVWGHNFKETADKTYKCRFGNQESKGEWLAWDHIVCTVPKHLKGTVTVEISPDGSEYTNDKLMYFFYSTCPLGSCGRDFNPSRGQCVFGTCSCFLPWTGENCTIELIPPMIEAISSNQTVKESEIYILQLKLEQGELPVTWYLAKGPDGMTVDEITGLVRWEDTVASSGPYYIDVRVSNIVDEDSATWLLFVSASYTVSVQNIEPNGVLPAPRPVKVFGKVTFIKEATRHQVHVKVIVLSSRTGHRTRLYTVTNEEDPKTFMVFYYPRPDDAGLFSVMAAHPGLPSEPNSTHTWSVLGMQCSPSTANVDLLIDQNEDTVSVPSISTLYNIGDKPIYNITAEVIGFSDAYVRQTGDLGSSKFYVNRLDIHENMSYDLHINNARPLSGRIYIMFLTNQGTSTGIEVRIKLSILKPVFSLQPSSLRENIVPGTIAIIDVNITNIGEVPARKVTVSLPNDNRLSVVSFASDRDSKEGILINPQESAYLSLSVVTENDEPLGKMTGTIYINSMLTSMPLPYTFVFVSLRRFNVTFTVKDEYTYFASGSPLVTNAKVKISNPRRGLSETRYTTNDTGYVIFEDLYEDQYSIFAEADGHSSYGAVILITSDTTEQDIFLPRVAVKYTWTVEQTAVEDIYKIELNSTFETYVPMPVVTIEPAQVDTLPLEMEGNSTIEFTITNHGLIRADNIRFSLPTTHPYLSFVSEVDFIGNIAANTSIIIPVRTTLKNRQRRSSGFVCVDILVFYSFECFGIQTRSVFVKLTRGQTGRSCSFSAVGGGSLYGRGAFIGYASATSITCDCIKTYLKSCVLAFIPGFGCPLAVQSALSSIEKGIEGITLKGVVLGVLDISVGCFGKAIPILGQLYTAVRCVMDLGENCSKKRKRREVSSEVVNAVILAAPPMENFINMGKEIIGNNTIALERTWYNEFKRSVGDDTELGAVLSNNESSNILQTVTDEVAKTNLSRFLERYNNTAAAWNNGSLTQLEDSGRVINLSRLQPMLQQFLQDMDNSRSRGYESIFDEYEKAVVAYNQAENAAGSSREKDGVCARVRIRILQEVVLTRQAFKARLEIENGESSDLENIKVEVQIKQTFGSGALLNDKFSIGKPTLIGISSVDGGKLGRELSGSAEWLIIPYSNAAPEDDTQYDIGGRLSYSVDGSEFSTILLPDTITVKPDPSLVVHYFHEKYVRGDDALTPEVEPIIPFTLAVMVTNDGYGIARAVKITSGQPEIVENEKGLLITFKIISAQLGNAPIVPSLTVHFGDIASFETKTARWLMTSTLMGTFYNFSASFENINPLGDPQLSLIDTLGYHELFHLVRIHFPQDDEVDDFLVNDFPDQDGIPEKLYSSANGSDVFDVHFVNVSDVQMSSYVSSSSKNYKEVNVTLFTNISCWFYTRVINNFTRSDTSSNEELISVVTNYSRNILIGKNAWQTTHILDTFFVHLFDYIDVESLQENTDTVKLVYILTYGPRNRHAPRFNSTSSNITVSNRADINQELVRVHAYDLDKDNLVFRLKNENISQFKLQQVAHDSVAVIVNKILSSYETVSINIIVQDDGIPSRSSVVIINVTITDGDDLSNISTSTDTSDIMTSTTEILQTSSATPDRSTNSTTNDNSSSNSLSWVIPVSVLCFVLLILIAVAIVCLVRKGMCLVQKTDSNIELR